MVKLHYQLTVSFTLELFATSAGKFPLGELSAVRA